jgi:signal transduction histidine kinase
MADTPVAAFNLSREPDAHRHLVVSPVPVGIVAVDDSGVIRACNSAAAELLKRPAGELLGRALGFPTVGDGPRQVDLMLPNGSLRSVEARVSTTTWQGQRLFVTSLQALMNAEEGDGDPQRELDHQALAVAATAHELDNSLFALGLAAQQLQRHIHADGRQRGELIASIYDGARRSQALVARLRVAVGIDEGEHASGTAEHVSVFDVLLERVNELRGYAQQVNLCCDPGVAVLVDRLEFAQMLDNYLHNARVHGGPPVEVDVTAHDGWVDIRVCDHGPGVPAALQSRLFDRFGRAPSSYQHRGGRGLGLWVTRGLARAYGGDAWYEPRHPHGACFFLRLPADNARG